MKKTLLASAIAAVVMAAPMSASANVVLYGKIHASIDYIDPNNDTYRVDELFDDVFDSNGTWSITNRSSRIGFKGSEDLGNGLKAIWKAETTYNLDNGGWGSGRNAYIGLAGDWGTVLMGKHDTPLKISTGRLDVFADTMADYNSTLGFVDRRTSNTIAYISPNWNGFSFAAAGVASEEYGDDLIGDGGYSLAAMYFNNGFYGSLAWEDTSDLGDGNIGLPVGAPGVPTTNQIFRVGLGYIMNAFTLGVVYERQTLDSDLIELNVGSSTDINKWMVSGAYEFGNNKIKGYFGQYDPEDPIILSSSLDGWAIGWDHKLSVRTKVYALYADSDLGLHDVQFENTDGVALFGANGFSMGMVHTF
ncbi:MAG: porin [Rhodothermales bacterium]